MFDQTKKLEVSTSSGSKDTNLGTYCIFWNTTLYFIRPLYINFLFLLLFYYMTVMHIAHCTLHNAQWPYILLREELGLYGVPFSRAKCTSFCKFSRFFASIKKMSHIILFLMFIVYQRTTSWSGTLLYMVVWDRVKGWILFCW